MDQVGVLDVDAEKRVHGLLAALAVLLGLAAVAAGMGVTCLHLSDLSIVELMMRNEKKMKPLPSKKKR